MVYTAELDITQIAGTQGLDVMFLGLETGAEETIIGLILRFALIMFF
jgi:hypothetical protein